MTEVVNIEGLKKSFGPVEALKDVSFKVNAGELVGLIGPNGAGKSTTVKILTGQWLADGGKIQVLDKDIVKDPEAGRKVVGYVPQEISLFPFLTGREVLEFAAETRGLKEGAKARIDSLLERFHLKDAEDRMTREYSEGMARKLSICAALVTSPPLLVLDESLNGLDPRATAEVKALIQEELKEGTAIILISHILDLLERLCDRVVLIEEGRVVKNLGREGLDLWLNEGRTLEDFFIEYTMAETSS